MNVGDLKEQLNGFNDDVEIHFGGLDFYRLKTRGEKLVHFEFNQTVYKDDTGKLVLEDHGKEKKDNYSSQKLQSLKNIPISNIENQLAASISLLLDSEPTIEGNIESLSFEFDIIEPVVKMKISFSRQATVHLDDDLIDSIIK